MRRRTRVEGSGVGENAMPAGATPSRYSPVRCEFENIAGAVVRNEKVPAIPGSPIPGHVPRWLRRRDHGIGRVEMAYAATNSSPTNRLHESASSPRIWLILPGVKPNFVAVALVVSPPAKNLTIRRSLTGSDRSHARKSSLVRTMSGGPQCRSSTSNSCQQSSILS